MHGVLKVKTTAQQEAERQKEREEKAAKFLKLTNQIFEKRRSKELDDELLSLTEKLLSSNPDYNTMWNIRKEIFLKFKEERSEEQQVELYEHELKFLQNCLHVNPKSYGVWEHRRFSLRNMPNPDWKRDLKLCNQFLTFDPRNFHCWDYRRFVVKNADISCQDEFSFTRKKISENFSNYSAWHNRSKLLPLVHPDTESNGKVDELALLKEFDLVQNAFFTDPNDQSAWFYQRWLLGREEREAEILHLSARRVPDGLRLMLSLSKQLRLHEDGMLEIQLDDKNIEDSIFKSNDGSDLPSYVWIGHVNAVSEAEPHKLRAKLGPGNPVECVLQEGSTECSWHWSQAESNLIFRDDHTAAKTTVLENELESCKMLHEEETENKWVMLTMVFLMRALDPEKHNSETYNLLARLMECDKLRKGYYSDLRSRYHLEDALRRMKRNREDFETLDLRNKELSAIYHWQYLTSFKKISLAGNKLTSLRYLHLLQNLKSLNLDGNQICTLDEFSKLPFLDDLSLRGNCITATEELNKLKQSSIKVICTADNPVCKSNADADEV